MARRRKSEDEEVSYWLSYSDMMAALLLVFVLIISFMMLRAQKRFEEEETKLKAQQEQLESQQEQIDKLVGVKSELIEALKQEFEGTDLKVTVDSKTGAITFDSSVLFDFDKAEIKPSGETFLKEFLPRYFGVLLKPEYKDYISEIIIEGHTDTNGEYLYNLKLSQERAFSVAEYCLDYENGIFSSAEIDNFRNIITANGRSFSDPIYFADGINVDMDASRRVEFKFRLTDEELIEEMIRILEENN